MVIDAKCSTSLVVVFSALLTATAQGQDSPLPTSPQRTLWTTSRVVGSPEPPLPYRVEPVYPKISWNRPLYAKAEPGTDFLLVVQQGGESGKPSHILRLPDDEDADQTRVMLQLDGRLIYGLEFHPDYRRNRQLLVFSNGPTGSAERQNRISRYHVSTDASPVCDPQSERVILEWRSMGHDGGDLVFGNDGMLYIASGDGTSDSDGWLSGQDITNLLGGVLRIDVDRTSDQRPYSIPPDNPFVDYPGARGELWAFGLRNPWRMNVDRRTGQIWVGNNGQDLWETAHLLGRGDNYGWSVYEGNHPFYLNRQRGPAAFVPPTIEHHHTEFRSLTGGVVYYGDELPDLQGAYVYGDYSTGKIWGARHDGTRLTWHEELASSSLQIAAFAVSPRGKLLIVDHGGGLHRLTRNPPPEQEQPFPRRLSETGLFVSTPEHHVQPGVIEYSVNSPAWSDGAQVQRFLGLPGPTRMEFTPSRGWNFPNGTVLMQTLSVAQPAADGATMSRRIETRLLTKQSGQWAGYSYRWDQDQTDALLVMREGEEFDLIREGTDGRPVNQRWRFPSRAECMSCHSRAANFVLGLTALQMNRDCDVEGSRQNQLRWFESLGLFQTALPKSWDAGASLVDPYDESQAIDRRARSYLHVNCSGCHVEAGGGNSRMELEYSTPLQRMNIVSVFPQHDTFGIQRPMLIAPGSPADSVLYQRLSRRGRGQMPPLVSQLVDRRAAALIHDWIQDMEATRKFVKEWTSEELLPGLDELQQGRSLEAGREAYRTLGCGQCHRLAGEGGGAGPDLTGLARRVPVEQLLESIVSPSKQVAPEYATTSIQTTAGHLVQGRIERETKTHVVLRTADPFAAPVTVSKDSIEVRRLSSQSIMPSGLLNSLHRDQILDLLAYLHAAQQHD